MYFNEGSALHEASKDHNHYVARIAHVCNCQIIPNPNALADILLRQYSFPPHSRTLMWRYLLRLPNNEQSYQVIANQPIHSKVAHLSRTLPVKFTSIIRRLKKVISCLVYWHPPLAECDWLPGLVFPFLQIFSRPKISTVEIIMTVIYNWCSEWLMFIPNPPVTVLSRIDHIAKEMGGSAPLNVGWPALRSFFGEVAKTESALMLMDNILASRPPFIEYLVASYSLVKGDREINSSNVKYVINRARNYYEKLFSQNHNQAVFQPLPENFYPILTIVQKDEMWKEKELQRIREEAEAMKNQMELKDEIDAETTKIERKRKSWMDQREALIEIEAQQMDDFRRREKEMLQRENIKEAEQIEERKNCLKTEKFKKKIFYFK